MLLYVEGGSISDENAAEIDQLLYPSACWPSQLAHEGLRRYSDFKNISKHKNQLLPNTKRRQVIKDFTHAMRLRIDAAFEAGKGHTPFTAPVVEIGFSVNPHQRLNDHRRHRSSNYLINLAEACMAYSFPKRFRLQQSFLCTCFRKPHPWLGEIILTQLGQGYAYNGEGFSYRIAGSSTGEAYRELTQEEWVLLEHQAEQSGELERERQKIGQEREQILRALEDTRARTYDDHAKQTNFLKALRATTDALTLYVTALGELGDLGLD